MASVKRVRDGTKISVMSHSWIPGIPHTDIKVNTVGLQALKVCDLIDNTHRIWNEEVIKHTFSVPVARRILEIPLSKHLHGDSLAWSGEASGILP